MCVITISVEVAIRGVDYVFHSAALKQVPSCEFFPIEATKTNVFGTDNVIRAAVANNVKNVICLSTDKASLSNQCYGNQQSSNGKGSSRSIA